MLEVTGRRRWVSVVDLSASTTFPLGRCVVFKIFCDGSNGDGVLTLASVSADVSLWCAVEREWMRALAELGIEEWHTADAVGRAKNSEFASWTHHDFHRAFDRLAAGVLFQFRHCHLSAYACSIIRADYERLIAEFPDFTKTPEAICVDVCVGGVEFATVPMGETEVNTIPFVGVAFDENEPFERTVRRVWQDKRKQKGSIFHQITQISSVNSRYFPAVQIADLIAWTIHRARSPQPIVGGVIHSDIQELALHMSMKLKTRELDYDGLVTIRAEYESERKAARAEIELRDA